MKYYLAIIQNDSSQAIYSYETKDAALAAFHAELAYRAESRMSTKCMLFDSDLVVIRAETYTGLDNN
jgi:hypothetical protein